MLYDRNNPDGEQNSCADTVLPGKTANPDLYMLAQFGYSITFNIDRMDNQDRESFLIERSKNQMMNIIVCSTIPVIK